MEAGRDYFNPHVSFRNVMIAPGSPFRCGFVIEPIAAKKTIPHKCKKPGKIASNDNVSGPSAKLVAGAGFEPTTFGL